MTTVTNTEASRLDRLPLEVLRLIVSVGTCEAVLALSEVNKILRAVCYDPLVYKAVIDNCNRNRRRRWQHHLPLSMESPVSSWARYALADSKAANLAALETATSQSWAPQLMAYHRQFLPSISSTCQ